MCLYKGWETCSFLINGSAETSSPQLGTFASWLWMKLMYDLRLVALSHLDEEEVMVVFLAFRRETY